MGAILGFFSGAAGRWLILLLVVAAAAAAAYVHGRQYERGIVDGERLKDADVFIDKLVARAAKDKREGKVVADALQTERDARNKDKLDFEERLRNVPPEKIFEVVEVQPTNEHAKPAAGESEPPSKAGEGGSREFRARISAVGCELWNAALAAGATAAERAGWIAGADSCAGAVEIEEALGNLRANAALLGQCRSREQLMHAWLEREGFTKSDAQ